MGLPRFTGLLRWSALGVLLLSVAAAAEPLTVDVRDAQAGYDPRTGQPVLAIRMGDAAAAFSRLTRDGVGRSMELRIDGKTVATSVVREPILGGTLQISGEDHEAYRALALRLRQPGAKVEVEIAPK